MFILYCYNSIQGVGLLEGTDFQGAKFSRIEIKETERIIVACH